MEQMLRTERLANRLTSRDLALVAVLAALLVIDGFASSLARQITRNTDTFFLMSAFFTVLALTTRKRWMASFLALITSLVFLAIPGAPVPIHIVAAVVANGLVFDITLSGLVARSSTPEPTLSQLAIAGTLGNGVMAAVILPLITLYYPTAIPLYAWPAVILADAFVGLLGVRFGYLLVKRLHVTTLVMRPVN